MSWLSFLRCTACPALVALIALGSHAPSDLLGQIQEPAKKQDQKPERFPKGRERAASGEVQIIPLKSALATEVSKTIKELYGAGWGRGAPSQVSITADAATNSLIVLAEKDELNAIKKLVSALDIESADKVRTTEVRIFQLRHGPADKALQDALRLVFTKPTGNFALDARRNAVICAGDRNTLDAAEALLERLDRQPVQAPLSGEKRVRIIWLVDITTEHAATKQLGQPPEDLKVVLEELAKFGITKPRLAAQILVNATEGNPFRIEGSTALGPHPCVLNISGQLTETQGKPSLHLELKAIEDLGKSRQPVCSLESQVSAPLGHFVVLGITPTTGMTSVFVVQVLSREPTKSR